MSDREKRHRVSREDVINNARESGSNKRWFKLPAGIREWWPDKAGTFRLDFVPYEVKIDNHPDRVTRKSIWYKYPFRVHNQIGPNNASVICPTTLGKPCPICEEVAKLKKDWDGNKDAIAGIRAKEMTAMIVIDPADAKKYAIFAYSNSKFAQVLLDEIKEKPKDALFYDVTSDGRTVAVRFADESFQGRKFLQANRIDFETRDEMDEDKVLAATPCLDEIFQVHGGCESGVSQVSVRCKSGVSQV